MKTQINHKSMALAVAAILTSLSSVQAGAETGDESRWQLKASAVVVDSGNAFSVEKPAGGRVYAGGNAALGGAVAIEYRLNNRVGLELGAIYAGSPDIDDSVNGNNDELGEGPRTFTVLGGANFRVFESQRVELYAGPRVAYVAVGDFDLDIDGQETTYVGEDQFTWGATAGLKYRFRNDRLSLIAEASYVDVDFEISQKGANDIVTTQHDPLMVSVGLAFGF